MAFYPSIECVLIDADGVRTPAASETFDAYNLTASVAEGALISDANGIIPYDQFGADGDLIEVTHATYPGVYRFNLRATADLAFKTQGDHGMTYVVENLQTPSESQRAVFIAVDLDNPNAVPVVLGSGERDTVTDFLVQQGPVERNLRIHPVTERADGSKGNTDYQLQTTEYFDVTIPSSIIPGTVRHTQDITAPTTSDDETAGHSAGSIWTHINNGAYICIDATPTAAVWVQFA